MGSPGDADTGNATKVENDVGQKCSQTDDRKAHMGYEEKNANIDYSATSAAPEVESDVRQKCEQENPYANANLLVRELYTYLSGIMTLGSKRPLLTTDLWSVSPDVDARVLSDLVGTAWKKEVAAKGASASLLRVLTSVFGFQYFLTTFLAIAEYTAGLLEPFFVSKLLEVLTDADETGDYDASAAWGYALAFASVALLRAYLHHPVFFRGQLMGMKIRVACVGLIYDKLLHLHNEDLAATTTGHMVNLIGNDTERFDQALPFLLFLVVGPMKTAAVTYLLYDKFGASSLVGLAFLLLLAPLQFLMSRVYTALRMKTTKITDQRVKLTNELITGIRLIKMYAWELPFSKAVLTEREREASNLRATSNVRAFNQGMTYSMSPLTMFIIISVYVHTTDNRLRTSDVFPAIMYLNVLRMSVGIFIPEAIKNGSEALVSVRRIQAFLLNRDHSFPAVSATPLDACVSLRNVSATWPFAAEDEARKKKGVGKTGKDPRPDKITGKKDPLKESSAGPKLPVLSHVNFTVAKGEFVAVTGPVGAGKSSLLSVILKELPVSAGSVQVAEPPTVASQEVWISSDTVRSNILFGRTFDAARYAAVVHACCLQTDFEQFEHGDATVIGERGITLSGGQRARISLARACYEGGRFFLLDDPLSAVDSIVAKQLFDRCFCDYLRGTTRVLITHQHHFLPRCDRVFELAGGTLTETTHAKPPLEPNAAGSNGGGRRADTGETEKNGDNAAKCADDAEETGRNGEPAVELAATVVGAKGAGPAAGSLSQEDRSVGAVGLATYWSYVRHAGILMCVVYLVCSVGAQAMFITTDYWLSRWAGEEEGQEKDEAFRYKYYAGFLGASVLLSFARSFVFFNAAISAGTSLHASMFSSVVRSPVRFFDTNPSGRVLNRFSKDMGQLDELLPWILIDAIQCGLLCFGGVVLVSVLNPWVLVIIAPLTAAFVFLRRYFVASAREIRRLEALQRSPLYASFSEGIAGLHTIRAYRRTGHFLRKYQAAQNDHSSAFFLFVACNRWLGFRLDLLSWVFISAVAIACVVARDSVSPADAALSLTYATFLAGSFQWATRQSAEAENQMTAAERIRAYTRLPGEPSCTVDPVHVPEDWPAKGEIAVRGFSLRYSAELPLVLDSLTFSVAAGEKVGVVGRTGAGKSSIMQALFRLVEAERGEILIDGVPTAAVPLPKLRAALSVIPQDPILFTGTLRYNLDPFGACAGDADLWSALRAVEMEPAIAAAGGGLDQRVSEGGKNFSVGQRQLLCLARTLLRHNRILVMDEATANVDPATDAVIQRTVRKRFAACTVITIAHRLHTVIDCDKILVLDAGKVAAFGRPHDLLQDGGNLLAKYVNETGAEEAASLRSIAEGAAARPLGGAVDSAPY
ncbi:putative multidrug resistance-associated protein lethal(2)03659 [Diplonema papillatum]|nr:putative multidrug resistance-associated protein lethal(2)03659 [Diplonema papillatum]